LSAPTTASYRLFAGVAIAARSATAAWLVPGRAVGLPLTFPQTPAGFAQFHQAVLAARIPPAEILVVMEATSTSWMGLATFLVGKGFAISVINSHQAHHFAKALLKRAKTDAIDAQTLAQLAAVLQPARWSPPPALSHELYQRLSQRDALLHMRGQLHNQRHALVQQPHVIERVRTRLDTLITGLTDELTTLERAIAALLQHDDAWAESARRLQTINGIGPLTAAWLLVTTLNFTLCPTPEAAVAFADRALNEFRSGSSVRGRASIGHTGNARLRTALYLAALSATRSNPVLKVTYTRLREAGKPAKVALCAVARKLVRIAWAVVTKEQDFDPQHLAAPQAERKAA
jgi:transposase